MSSSTADKLLPGNCCDLLQVFAKSPIVVSNLSRRGASGDGSETEILYSNARIQRYVYSSTEISSDPMIYPRSHPNAYASLVEILNLLHLKTPHISKHTPNEPMGTRTRAEVTQIRSC